MTFKVGDRVRCKDPTQDKRNGVGVVVVNNGGLTTHAGKPLCHVYFKPIGTSVYYYVESIKLANFQRNLPAWW